LSFAGNQYTSDEGYDLSTKGDIHGFSTVNAAVGVGSNNQIIYADSANALGVAYGASAKSVLSTTGDLLYASGANTLQRLAATTSGYVLTAQGAGVAPVYAAAAGGGSLELLNNEELTGAGSFTYTPASALLSADYSEIIVITTYAPSASNPELIMNVNGVSTGYHVDGSAIQGGVQTLYDLNNQAAWNIGYDAEANRSNACITSLFMSDADYTGTQSLIGITQQYSGGSVFYQAGIQMNTTTVQITVISVGASTGDLQIGSKMAVYGRKRA